MTVGGAPDVVLRVIVRPGSTLYAETEMQGVELARAHRDPVFADVLDRRGAMQSPACGPVAPRWSGDDISNCGNFCTPGPLLKSSILRTQESQMMA